MGIRCASLEKVVHEQLLKYCRKGIDHCTSINVIFDKLQFFEVLQMDISFVYQGADTVHLVWSTTRSEISSG